MFLSTVMVEGQKVLEGFKIALKYLSPNVTHTPGAHSPLGRISAIDPPSCGFSRVQVRKKKWEVGVWVRTKVSATPSLPCCWVRKRSVS